MQLILIALSFFTRIPIKTKKQINEEIFFKSMLLLPFIGLIIGFILYCTSYILDYLNYDPIEALIILLLYFILTGGLHYDGLSDSLDALFSNRKISDLKKIMKDPYVGTFGSLGICLSILSLYICFLYIFEKKIIILLLIFPMIGRFGAIELGAFFKPDKKNKGLGFHFCKVDKPIFFWTYLIVISSFLFFLSKLIFIISFIIVIIETFFIGVYLKKKSIGISGDFLGLIVEIDQIIFLLSFIILNNIRIFT